MEPSVTKERLLVECRLRDSFWELRKLLEEEGEANWIRGVDGCLTRLSEEADAGDDLDSRLRDVRSIFRTMMGGAGTLGDYVIWRDDFSERVAMNQKLDKINSDIWRQLEKLIDAAPGPGARVLPNK